MADFPLPVGGRGLPTTTASSADWRPIRAPSDRKSDGKASKGVSGGCSMRALGLDVAAPSAWRYNIVAAAKPVTDRDNGQQPSRGCVTSGGVGAAPGAQKESAGG